MVPAEWARVAKAEHRIAEWLQRAEGEAGLVDCRVRTRMGWHGHRTLSLLAVWLPGGTTRRGENPDAGVDRAAGSGVDRGPVGGGAGWPRDRDGLAPRDAVVAAKRAGAIPPRRAARPAATVEEPTTVPRIQSK